MAIPLFTNMGYDIPVPIPPWVGFPAADLWIRRGCRPHLVEVRATWWLLGGAVPRDLCRFRRFRLVRFLAALARLVRLLAALFRILRAKAVVARKVVTTAVPMLIALAAVSMKAVMFAMVKMVILFLLIWNSRHPKNRETGEGAYGRSVRRNYHMPTCMGRDDLWTSRSCTE